MEVLNKIGAGARRALIVSLNAVQRKPLVQRVLIALLLSVFFFAALYLRIHFTSDVVFGGTWSKFTGIDAYWHARIIDNLAHNFPYLASADPYLLYPWGGSTSLIAPFFDYLLAGVIWVIGLGSPTPHTVDVVAALFPPVMGALTIFPVYFIGKTLASRWAGLIAALLVAIMPGEFLGRSILGFIDHHVAETLFTTTAMMFLLLALKGIRKERLTWQHLRHPRTSGLAAPLTFALLGGFFLGLFMASWIGALLFVFILAAFFVVQFCIDHVSRVPTDYLGLVGVATFLPALLVFVILGQSGEVTAALGLAVLIPAALFGLSRFMAGGGALTPADKRSAAPGKGLAAARSKAAPAAGNVPPSGGRAAQQGPGKAAQQGPGKAAGQGSGRAVPQGSGGSGWARALLARLQGYPLLYPATVLLAGLGAFLLLWLVKRPLYHQFTEHFVVLDWNSGTSVSEMIPFLWERTTGGGGHWTLAPFWNIYGFTTIFAVLGLLLLGYFVVRRREPEKVLLLVWTAIILLAALAQRRFNYYLVVNIAVLAGYGCWYLLYLAGLKGLTAEPRPAPPDAVRKREKGRKPRAARPPLNPAYAFVAVVAIGMFCLVTVVPYTEQNLGAGTQWVTPIDLAQYTADRDPANPRYEPHDAWCESLEWLKNNTPDPFPSAEYPDYYYARYRTPLDYSAFPDAYGIMAWWDYGYWIARIGHRPPCQNPGGALPPVCEFFIAQTEADGAKIMDQFGGRYVILDYQLMNINLKFYGPFAQTGKATEDYWDTFLVQSEDQQGAASYTPALFFYPSYYRCLSVRMYLFDGRAVTPAPGDCKVITWTRRMAEGREYKVVTQTQAFNSYAAAEAFVASKASSGGNYSIVSSDPRVSPVPLEGLTSFSLVHDSVDKVRWSSSAEVPYIRIFEYTG